MVDGRNIPNALVDDHVVFWDLPVVAGVDAVFTLQGRRQVTRGGRLGGGDVIMGG